MAHLINSVVQCGLNESRSSLNAINRIYFKRYQPYILLDPLKQRFFIRRNGPRPTEEAEIDWVFPAPGRFRLITGLDPVGRRLAPIAGTAH